MSGMNFRRPSRSVVLSGGQLRVPKTRAESLALYLKMHKLKRDYLRRRAR